MPRNLVKTEEQERGWNKAVSIAAEHFGEQPSTSQHWAYVVGIYSNMGFLDRYMEEDSFPYLPLGFVLAALPAMRAQRVSKVARSRRGFIAAYRRAKGRPENLEEMTDRDGVPWAVVRRNFLKRHIAQMDGDGWRDGEPTRRHLALVAWAYSPTPERLMSWLAKQRGVRV